MNLILLGAPGAGKGTQAVKIAAKYGVPHISTGDIFRQNIKDKTPIGLTAKEYIDRGELVPDAVTVEIVRERLLAEDCKNGYLLDGFPRNVAQAEELGSFTGITAVINIDIDLKKLLKRLTGRRVCSECGESYHVDLLNGSEECATCGGALFQREDDREETVSKRLAVYQQQTQPLIAYYREKGLLKDVDGNGGIDEVFARIEEVISSL